MNFPAAEKAIPNESAPEAEKSERGKSLRTRTSDVLARLRSDILKGSFMPGQRLHLDELSEIYKAGYSPLREALSRLAADELVVLAEYKGYRVAPISRKDWLDILMMRCELESLGLQLSMAKGDESWLASVRKSFDEMMLEEPPGRDNVLNPNWERCHRAFHRSLLSACDSPWLMRISDMLVEQSSRYLSLSMLTPAWTDRRKHKDEHAALMEAISEGDATLATALLRSHLKRTSKMLMMELEQDQA